MKPGIHDIPAAEYHADPAISIGSLIDIQRSPARWRWSIREETRAMALGTAAHCAILEPTRFDREYAVYTGAGAERSKGYLAAQSASAATLLLPDEMALVMRAREAAWEHPVLQEFFADGAPEQSAFWIDRETCTACKCRPDWATPGGVLIDLKLVRDASVNAFVRDCADYAHHARAAWYIDGWEAAGGGRVSRYIFALLDKSMFTDAYQGPVSSAVALYELAPADIDRGRLYYRRAMNRYLECLEHDRWPGYPATVTTVDLPNWRSF